MNEQADISNRAWLAITELAGISGGLQGAAAGIGMDDRSPLSLPQRRADYLHGLSKQLDKVIETLKDELHFPDWPTEQDQ